MYVKSEKVKKSITLSVLRDKEGISFGEFLLHQLNLFISCTVYNVICAKMRSIMEYFMHGSNYCQSISMSKFY